MNFSGKKKKAAASINVTPLIDVVFLLLIFVLLAAKFETESSVKVDLPEGKSKENKKSKLHVLSITKDGTMYFQKDKITLEQLPKRIEQMREEIKEPVLAISADKETPYEFVAKATDVIKRSKQSAIVLKMRGGE